MKRGIVYLLRSAIMALFDHFVQFHFLVSVTYCSGLENSGCWSVLVINGVDVSKHCVPAVQTRRISLTLRKLSHSRLPVGYVPELDLIGLRPLSYDSIRSPRAQPSVTYATKRRNSSRRTMVERDGIYETKRLTSRIRR